MAKLSTGFLATYPVQSDVRHTVKKMRVGTLGADTDGNIHQYVRASGAITAYAPVAVVSQSGLNDVVESPDVKGYVGVAAAAFATREYGTVVVKGKTLALVPSGTAVGAPLTAGAGAFSATLTNAVGHATALEEAPILSGTTQAKYVWLH
jgi:hypothetical protein